MKHKIIWGLTGGVIVSVAVAVPLAVTLTQNEDILSELEIKLRDSRKELDDLKAVYISKLDENENLEKIIEEYNQDIEDSNSELSESIRRRDEAEHRLFATSASIGSLESRKNILEMNIQLQESDLLRLRAEIISTTENIEALNTRIEVYAVIGGSDAEIQEANNNLDEQRQRLEELRNNEAEVSRQHDADLLEIADIQRQLNAESEELALAQEEVEKNQAVVDELQRDYNNALQKLQQNNQEIIDMQSRMTTLEQDIDELKAIITRDTQTLDSLNAKINQWKSMISLIPQTAGFDVPIISNTTITDTILLSNLVSTSSDLVSPITQIVNHTTTSITSPSIFTDSDTIEKIVFSNLTSLPANAFVNAPLTFIYLPKLTYIMAAPNAPYAYYHAFASTVNAPTTTVFLPVAFNKPICLNEMFGRDNWNNINFIWV